jgi:hypothetical protein
MQSRSIVKASELGEDIHAGLAESLVIDQQVEHDPGFEFWGEL